MEKRDYIALAIISAVLVFAIFFMKGCQQKDYEEHMKYVGMPIVINGDTSYIMDWQSGGVTSQREYILSNGLLINEEVVNHAK